MSSPTSPPTLLLVGGTGGLAGRSVREVLRGRWRIRSVHRHPVEAERADGIEWIPADAASVVEWGPMLAGVDAVVNLAWYRQGRERRFRDLAEGLVQLIRASRDAGIARWVQLSVPTAPPALESELPYLRWKRYVDRELANSGLSYSILRASMLFGPRDKLLTVMMRTMARYHRFPMFGDGEYHLSPIAARDVARAVLRELTNTRSGTFDAGGPRRWRYHDLTDRMFQELGLRPRYFRISPTGSVRLARLLEGLGSSLLYAYEVEWLLSDLLGPPPYSGLDPPLEEVGPFVREEAARLGRGGPSPSDRPASNSPEN